MNIALTWLKTLVNSTNTLRYWYVDSFPDLDACLRDPNRYIDQKFTDWVTARDSRDPPDYLIDMQHRVNTCNVMNELDVSTNGMRNVNINYTESYLDGTNQTEAMLISTHEIDHQRKTLLDGMNNNLDENRTEVRTIGELEKVDTKKCQQRSKRKRTLKCKKSNRPTLCVSKPHPFSEVPKGGFSSRCSKTCRPLREIQDAPYRMYVEESPRPSTLRGRSETKSSKFAFNISVFRCTVNGCGKLYRRRSHLQSHVRRHTGERPFPCTWNGCKWKFSRSDELVRHMRSHSGDKPFNCTTCSKRFARSDHLKKHLRVHQKALMG